MIDRPAPGRSMSRRKRWAFRGLAVLLGLGAWAVAEAVCVWGDWGRPSDVDDPLVGFSSVQPLFVPSEGEDRYEIAPARRKFFAHDSFSANKAAGTFRVFCLGGSTVQGRPYSIASSFTTWLRLALQAGEPERRWEVVNCGGISYASYRLVPILMECLKYDPDLFILCTGHNEFLEDRTYGHLKDRSTLGGRLHEGLLKLRTYTLLRRTVLELSEQPADAVSDQRDQLGGEVDALLDYRGGLAAYERNDAWRANVIEHYELNVRRMVRIARKAGVPIVLVRPTSNLSDCPPFKSQHRAGLSEQERRRWESIVDRAKALYRSDLPGAIELLQQALEIDGEYAVLWYELGKCYESLGLDDLAEEAFVKARDLDICPLRILSPMEAALQRVAEEMNVPLVDAQLLLQSLSPDRIPGDYLLVDHIHPSVEGHQVIATELARRMQSSGWFHPDGGWDDRRNEAYAQHLGSLDAMYFLRGQRMLESLRLWTKGRADGPPLRSGVKAGGRKQKSHEDGQSASGEAAAVDGSGP